MNTRWLRTTFLVALLAGVIAVATVLVSIARESKLPSPITLPTGDVVKLRGITWGTNHIAPGGFRVLRLLPTTMRQQLQSRFSRHQIFTDRTTAQPAMLIWIEVQPPQKFVTTDVQTWVMLADASGVVAGERQNISLFGPAKLGVTAQFNAVPRDGSELLLLWVQGDYQHPKIVARSRVTNPAVASPSLKWQAEKLPVSRSDGELECTLERVVFGVSSSTGPGFADHPAQEAEPVHAVALVHFRQAGGITTQWTVEDLAMRDTTGNQLRGGSMSWFSVNQSLCFNWSPTLWPGHPWELHIRAKRKPDASFGPGELVVFGDLPVRGPGSTNTWLWQTNVSGVRLVLEEFVLREAIAPGKGWSSDKISQLRATIHAGNDKAVDLVGLTDGEGKRHQATSWGTSGSGTAAGSEITYSFPDIPSDTRRLSVTFAVQPRRHFTFRVMPESLTNRVSRLGR